MSELDTAVEDVKEGAGRAAAQVATHPWTERLARFGYAAKGLVYIVVGALAILAATGGHGDDATDTRGALRAIAGQPSGRLLLGTVASGLAAYVLWRVVQSLTDADRKGRELKGLALRAGYLGSGLVYAGLAFSAARILAGTSGDDRRSLQESWTAELLRWPYGRWLVLLGGLAVIGFGLYQCYKGYGAKFRKRLKLHTMSERAARLATLSGRVGYIARGVVFCMIGAFLIQAGWHYNPREAKGLDGALQTLAQQSFGPWLLGAVAAGLAAYGLYSLVEARYRRIAGS